MSETDLKSAEALIARGERLEARATIARVLGSDPGNVHAQHLLATIDMDEGQYDAARLKLEQILEARPEMAAAIYNLGVCLLQLQRYSDANTQFERALVLDPGHSGAMYNIAWLLSRSGRVREAAQRFAALVKHNPNWLSAREALIETHLARRQPEDALAEADEVFRRSAGNDRIMTLRGNALFMLGRLAEAEANFKATLTANSIDVDALFGLSSVFRRQGKDADAIKALDRALAASAVQPQHRDRFDALLSEAVIVCRHQMDTKRVKQLTETAHKRVVEEGGAVSPNAIQLLFDDPKLHQTTARRAWPESSAAKVERPAPRPGTRALNIGWLSDDFGDHAGSYQLSAFIDRHDRSKVKLFGYNVGLPIPSDIRFKLRHSFDDFKSVREMSDERAVQIMRDDELDLLVCTVHFGGNWRPGLLLLRPAPVAASYLGNPGTMGHNCVDYIIADSHLIRPGEDGLFDEAVVRLENAARCILAAPPPTSGYGHRSDHSLSDQDFVFANFSPTEALGEDTLDCWAQILKNTPKSVLWLGETRHSVRTVIRSEAKQRGINEDQLVFGSLVSRDLHLARLTHADLYLDTLTYQEASPVHDALSAGLPVLSLAGKSFSGRTGSSLVAATGQAGLVASTPSEYISTAVRLGRARKEAQELRNNLKTAMGSSPLFQQDRFLGQLQRAFEMIIERNRAGAPAASFDVPA